MSKSKKQKTVFVSGVFNVLHPGHFRFFKYARQIGTKLVVGVLSDVLAPFSTIDQDERLVNVCALSYVDEAFILNVSPEEYIGILKPEIVVKGWEHHDKENPEKFVLDKFGGSLIFSSGDIKFSGIHLNYEKKKTNDTIIKPNGFMKRHSFSEKDLVAILNKFSSLNICVVGDIIVDDYLDCEPVGMSQEDPTIVVRPLESKKYLGGAGIVASHASNLGASVHFLSICGNDDAGVFSKQLLKKSKINHKVIIDNTRSTTQKRRFRANGKTLLRVNDYADHPISEEVMDNIVKNLEDIVSKLDLIIFSDFSYGVLPKTLIQRIKELTKNKNILMTADSQSSSQIGDILKFKDLCLITPTEREARLGLNNFTDGLVTLGDKIKAETLSSNVIITLGQDGIFITGPDKNNSQTIINDRLPALQQNVVDVAGAGDALLVAASMALALDSTIWEASFIGSLASALQVSQTGNIPLDYNSLLETCIS